LLDSFEDAVIAVDSRGCVAFMNAAACALAGRPRNASIGRPVADVLAHLGPDAMAAIRANPVAGQSTATVVEGSQVAFEIRSSRIGAGADAGGLLLIRDARGLRRTQRRLEERRRLAAVGQLAAGMAHDFNNILTVVIGIAERLRNDERLARPVRAKLDMVAQQGQRASRLIQQMMDFSRRSVSSARQPIDLRLFLQQSVRRLRRRLPSEVAVTSRVHAGTYLVQSDPAQLQQVLTNLALNARDAMPNGGTLQIELTSFRLRRADTPPLAGMPTGDWVKLMIADSGMGMPPTVLAHTFEPFFTTKEPGRGTGLGLAQVYGLVTQQDGFIDVKSEVGRGTTFTIYLPSSGAPLRVAKLPSTRRAPKLRGAILLVDDEPGVRTVLTWQLKSMGHRVVAASDGEQAIDVARERGQDIVLGVVDWALPGLSGAPLCLALRTCIPQLPLIVLSGYAHESDALNDELGADRGVQFLRKPVRLEELSEAVRQALAPNR